mgnify:FL=1|jgi:hypothetical protein
MNIKLAITIGVIVVVVTVAIVMLTNSVMCTPPCV